jgi:hypothetical protein
VVLFGEIIVDEANWLKPETRIRNELLGNEFSGITRSDYQRGTTWIGSTPAVVCHTNSSGEQTWERDCSGCKECVDKHDREGDAGGGYLSARHDPESNDGRQDRRDSSGNENLPQLTNAGMTPKAPIHAKIVENDESNRTGKQDVGEYHPYILSEPAEIFEANSERDEWRYHESCCIEQKEMPVSHPPWQERLEFCHLLAYGWTMRLVQDLALIARCMRDDRPAKVVHFAFRN